MSVLLRLRERDYKTEQSVGRKCGCGGDLAKQAPRKPCASDTTGDAPDVASWGVRLTVQ